MKFMIKEKGFNYEKIFNCNCRWRKYFYTRYCNDAFRSCRPFPLRQIKFYDNDAERQEKLLKHVKSY